MSCAVPPIVMDLPIYDEIIKNREDGFVFEYENSDELAGKINELLENNDLRKRVGKRARNTVKKEYSIDFVADRYIKLYENLTS